MLELLEIIATLYIGVPAILLIIWCSCEKSNNDYSLKETLNGCIKKVNIVKYKFDKQDDDKKFWIKLIYFGYPLIILFFAFLAIEDLFRDFFRSLFN